MPTDPGPGVRKPQPHWSQDATLWVSVLAIMAVALAAVLKIHSVERQADKNLKIGRFIGNCDIVELLAKDPDLAAQVKPDTLTACRETRAKYADKLG